MADITIKVGFDTGIEAIDACREDLKIITKKVEEFDPKVRVGLTIDDKALNNFKKKLEGVLSSVSDEKGAPIKVSIKGIGDISSGIEKISESSKKSSDGAKKLNSSLKPVLDTYKQMHQLARQNKDANDKTTRSYAGLTGQISEFKSALELAYREQISIESAFERMGVDVKTALGQASEAMSKYRAEMEHTGRAGTVSAKQLYDTVSKMQDAIVKYDGASTSEIPLESYGALLEQSDEWIKAAENVRKHGMSVEEALASIGNASDSAGAKVSSLLEAISALHEEAKTSGYLQAEKFSAQEDKRTASADKLLDTQRKMDALLSGNKNAQHLESFRQLSEYAKKFSVNIFDAKGNLLEASKIVSQFGSTGADSIAEAQTMMAALNAEMERAGVKGTTTIEQMKEVARRAKLLIDAQDTDSGPVSNPKFATLNSEYNKLVEAIRIMEAGGVSAGEVLNKLGISAVTAMANAQKATSDFKAELSGAGSETTDLEAQLRRLDTIISQTEKDLAGWTMAEGGKSKESYAAMQEAVNVLRQYRENIASSGRPMENFNDEISKQTVILKKGSAEIKNAGENTKSFTDHLGGLVDKFGSWLSVSQAVMFVIRSIKDMARSVIELDTAMTELKKVTDETNAVYDRFLKNAAVRARDLGTTLNDVVIATADFVKLGHSIKDASNLADAAIVYKNVGDGIDSISQASESLISTMQAFSVKASDVMSIVDRFNHIGNRFAISSTGIGEALLRSAAAMNAAGNTLNETIALATAANTVVQNPEVVGTTLKSVSMFLRAAKTEAEEAGESTEGMADSVSELRREILALTGQRVDIQIDDDTFKSTYQILKELSEVWDDLSDVSKANILEMVGGKRNSNIVSSLIEQFELAEKVMAETGNAMGSALAENEKYLDSIQGRIDKFQASFQALSASVIDSDWIKIFISSGTALIDIITALIDCTNGLALALAAIPTVKLIGSFKLVQEAVGAVKTTFQNFVGGAK